LSKNGIEGHRSSTKASNKLRYFKRKIRIKHNKENISPKRKKEEPIKNKNKKRRRKLKRLSSTPMLLKLLY